MNAFIMKLSLTFDENEKEQIQRMLQLIHDRSEQVQNSDFSNWADRAKRLAQLRIQFSGTFKKGNFENWNKANFFIEQQIQLNKPIEWDSICHLNSLLTDHQVEEVVRKNDVFIGPHSGCQISELPGAIQYFCQNILPLSQNAENLHPLVSAAFIQYWLVSIHPFTDGNGRTSVLVADWIASHNQFFPQSFERKIDGIIAHFHDRKTHATPARAVIKVLNNILRSYDVFLE